MNIGKVRLKNNLVMAPMAGITDFPFRTLAREAGAGLVCSEMFSSKAIIHGHARTVESVRVKSSDHPLSVQIFGSAASDMAESARIVEDGGADIVDINLGCPVRKIVKSGAGVKTVENEQRLRAIMEGVVKQVKIPVTVKIRTGFDGRTNISSRVAKIAEESGIKMVAVHGRPAERHHSGAVDLDAIKETVDSVRIPVIGNGGVKNELTAREFFDKTGCAGLMIGRAAIGDPGLFKRIEHFMDHGDLLPAPTWEEKIELLKKHAERSSAHYGEKRGIIVLRKIAAYYLKGMPNASRVRQKFNAIESLRELEALLGEIWESPYFAEETAFE
ncbi:MAG: tRNA dihydrouridine synthase DusB [Endomicrobiales bacterium]|nr:tRNA dihydrouridine synthase DusB [Endomicrobiales bacterium]